MISNKATDHPKVVTLIWDYEAGLAAFGKWVIALSWAKTHGSDVIPRDFIGDHDFPLVQAGFIRVHDDGWQLIPDDTLYKLGRLHKPGVRAAISKALRLRIYERDGHRCQDCGAASNLSIDHIFPVTLGGTNTADNLQTLCRSCNSRKGARV